MSVSLSIDHCSDLSAFYDPGLDQQNSAVRRNEEIPSEGHELLHHKSPFLPVRFIKNNNSLHDTLRRNIISNKKQIDAMFDIQWQNSHS